MQANINLEYEKRIENVENEIAAMKKEREENGKLLLSLSLSPEVIPQLSIRDNIRQLVNRYAEAPILLLGMCITRYTTNCITYITYQ